MSNWPTAFESNNPGAIDSFEVGELLASLTDKNLVVLDEATGRYRLFESVRDYARILLASACEVDGMRTRHRDYFIAFAEEAEPQLTGRDQREWLERLEREHENFRASLERSLGEESAEAGLRLCGALQHYWWTRGYVAEGRDWCEQSLGYAGAERTKERANALNGAGLLAYYQGEHASARTYHLDSLSIRREIGDRRGIASSLNNLGNVAYSQGEYISARAYHLDSLSIWREIGDRRGIAGSLQGLGNVAYDQGDYASALAHYAESLTFHRKIGDRLGIAILLGNLGNVASNQGDFASAWTYGEESLSLFREIGDRRGIAFSLNNLGSVATNQGDYALARTYQEKSLSIRLEIGDRRGIAISLESFASLLAALQLTERSARLWGAAETLREEIGAPLPPNEREEYDRLLASASQDLGEAAFSRAWAEGRAMTMEQAIELALEEPNA